MKFFGPETNPSEPVEPATPSPATPSQYQYKRRVGKDATYFDFKTDNGCAYNVLFGLGTIIFAGNPLEEVARYFGYSRCQGLYKKDESESERVRLTITAILYDFIDAHPNAILGFTYAGSGLDHRFRHRTFDRWFDEESPADIAKIDIPTWDDHPETGVNTLYYLSIILREDNPYIDQIGEAVKHYLQKYEPGKLFI